MNSLYVDEREVDGPYTTTKPNNTENPKVPSAPIYVGEENQKVIDENNDEQIGHGEENHPEDVEDAEPYMDTGEKWKPIGLTVVNQEKPVDDTPRCRPIWNWICCFFILTLLICGIIFTVQQEFIGMIISWVFLGLFLIGYLIENFTSSTSQYLQHFESLEESEKHIATMQNVCPTLTFHIQCYHYRTYTTTSTDSNGNTTTQTHTERVNTWYNSSDYVFDCWQDFTNFPDYEELHPVTKYRFHKAYAFADDYTQNDFQQSKTSFIQNFLMDGFVALFGEALVLVLDVGF